MRSWRRCGTCRRTQPSSICQRPPRGLAQAAGECPDRAPLRRTGTYRLLAHRPPQLDELPLPPAHAEEPRALKHYDRNRRPQRATKRRRKRQESPGKAAPCTCVGNAAAARGIAEERCGDGATRFTGSGTGVSWSVHAEAVGLRARPSSRRVVGFIGGGWPDALSRVGSDGGGEVDV